MKMLKYTIILTLILLWSCTNPPDYSDTPEIEFLSFSKTSMVQSASFGDTTILTISFTDGDGDLGHEDGTKSIFFKDLRDDNDFIKYETPKVSEQGTGNGISGELYIEVYSTCCIHPDGLPPCNPANFQDYPIDSLQYEVYIEDRAGNKSNIITTDPIFLVCNQ